MFRLKLLFILDIFICYCQVEVKEGAVLCILKSLSEWNGLKFILSESILTFTTGKYQQQIFQICFKIPHMLKTSRLSRAMQKKYVLISSKYDHIKISKLPFLLSQQCTYSGAFVWNGRQQKQEQFERFPFFSSSPSEVFRRKISQSFDLSHIMLI